MPDLEPVSVRPDVQRTAAAWNRLLGAALVACAAGCGAEQGGQPSNPPAVADARAAPDRPRTRPNVLLISIDTLRADHLGCYGYPRPTSPNLDRLAAAGVRFAQCRAQAPWTLPSHLSLFTSQLPSDNGVDNLNAILPAGGVTLAELLRDAGYRTAALVNNGQMQAHWGLNRGFQEWREFEVDAAEGDCESIAAAALDWLRAPPADAPWLLFLHFFDPHDPYAPPPELAREFNAPWTGATAREFCFQHRTPRQPPADPARLAELIRAYDAEIARVDRQVGRLLAAAGEETLVIVFSDHGEAFKEHGWLLHGATLYEEELRVPLLVRLPASRRQETARPVVAEPAMLLDVAPTILAACGQTPPAAFQGDDLGPWWRSAAAAPAPRLIPAESKAVLEGRYLLAATIDPLKAIYSPFDGRLELYRLPDEQRDLSQAEPEAAAALFGPLAEWMARERYWFFHAAGEVRFEATIEVAEGNAELFIPVGCNLERDDLETVADGRGLRWRVAVEAGQVKSLFLRTSPPHARVRLAVRRDGREAAEALYLGAEDAAAPASRLELPPDLPCSPPAPRGPFVAPRPGFYVRRHAAGDGGPARPNRVAPLDEDTIRRLKSLGYLR